MSQTYKKGKPLSKNPLIIPENFQSQKEITLIESSKFISSLDIKGIWNYRELLYFLALRDVKIRYKQTLLGIAWVLLQPILTTLIFTTIFFKFGSVQDLPIPYPLFSFSGFTLWIFISSAIMNCSNSLLNHSSLVTKVYFPRLVIPFSAVLATLVDFFFGLISLFFAMLLYGITPHWTLLLLPLIFIPMILISLGLGIITAAINVKYRDVKYVLPFLIQLLFFISPVFYTLKMLPPESLWLWNLNPITGLLENFRSFLFGLPPQWNSYLITVSISFLIFLLSIYIFHKLEDDFADFI